MRNCDELPTAIVTLLTLVLLLASLENKVFQYGITVNSMHTSTVIVFFITDPIVFCHLFNAFALFFNV